MDSGSWRRRVLAAAAAAAVSIHQIEFHIPLFILLIASTTTTTIHGERQVILGGRFMSALFLYECTHTDVVYRNRSQTLSNSFYYCVWGVGCEWVWVGSAYKRDGYLEEEYTCTVSINHQLGVHSPTSMDGCHRNKWIFYFAFLLRIFLLCARYYLCVKWLRD